MKIGVWFIEPAKLKSDESGKICKYLTKSFIILSCEYMIFKFESVNNIKYKIFEFNFESIIL